MAIDQPRNRYRARCCDCQGEVPPGAGFLLRSSAGFRVRCEDCQKRQWRFVPTSGKKHCR